MFHAATAEHWPLNDEPEVTETGKRNNSRHTDIERTAQEIIEKVRSEWLRPDTNQTQRWVTELLCSDLPANAKLYGLVSRLHGGWGERIFPSMFRMQVLTSLSLPTAIKAKNALIAAGFMELEEGTKKSKGRLPDILKMAFPDAEEHVNGKADLPLSEEQPSNSFRVGIRKTTPTLKIDASNPKESLADLSLPYVEEDKNTPRARAVVL
jgi:hypothetical protein